MFGGEKLMVLLQSAIISSKSTTRLQKHEKCFQLLLENQPRCLSIPLLTWMSVQIIGFFAIFCCHYCSSVHIYGLFLLLMGSHIHQRPHHHQRSSRDWNRNIHKMLSLLPNLPFTLFFRSCTASPFLSPISCLSLCQTSHTCLDTTVGKSTTVSSFQTLTHP